MKWLSRRTMSLAVLVFHLGMGTFLVGCLVSVNSLEKPSLSGREKPSISGRFIHEGDKVYLYSLEIRIKDHELAKWELPSLKCISKQRLSGFAEPLPLEFSAGPVLKAAKRTTRIPAVPVYDILGNEYLLELGRQAFVTPVPRKSVEPADFKKRCNIIVLDDDKYLLWDGDTPCDKIKFSLHKKKSKELALLGEWVYKHPVRDILHIGTRDDRITMLYLGIHPEEVAIIEKYAALEDRLRHLSPWAPVCLAVFDPSQGKLLEDRRLGIDLKPPVFAFEDFPQSDNIYLLDSRENIFTLSLTDFQIKQHRSFKVPTEEGNSVQEPDSRRTMCADVRERTLVVKKHNGYLVYMSRFGVMVRSWPSGEVVLVDATHEKFTERLARAIDDPIEAALTWLLAWGLEDVTIIDNKKLAVVAGTGHVYIYDLEQRKRTHVIPLSKWATKNMPE